MLVSKFVTVSYLLAYILLEKHMTLLLSLRGKFYKPAVLHIKEFWDIVHS